MRGEGGDGINVRLICGDVAFCRMGREFWGRLLCSIDWGETGRYTHGYLVDGGRWTVDHVLRAFYELLQVRNENDVGNCTKIHVGPLFDAGSC